MIEAIWVLVAFIVFGLAFERARLGSIVGLFAAGAVIGPNGFGLVRHIGMVDVLAELGITFLLFSIGLELKLDRFRLYGWRTYALAIAQMLVTAGALAMVASRFGLEPLAAAIVGGALAFSSTALVLQILHDLGRTLTTLGRLAVAILLIQDIGVGLFLVGIESLGSAGESLFDVPIYVATLVGAIGAIVLLGRLVMPVVLRVVSQTGNQEAFLATVLIVVLAASFGLEHAGGSAAIGAFLAGLLVADTEFRHQIAADIAPLRQLLLGIFFMAVGMKTDLTLISDRFEVVIGLAVGLVAVKAVIVAVLALALGHPWRRGAELGLLLAEGSEFTFVILTAAAAGALVSPLTVSMLIAAVAISMALVAIIAGLARPALNRIEGEAVSSEDELKAAARELADHVVVIGFGQVGMALSRHLVSQHIPVLVIDYNARRVQAMKRTGLPLFFGNALRSEVLRSCRLEDARLIIVAVPDGDAGQRILELVLRMHPGALVLLRAENAEEAERMIKAGARSVVIDGLTTALELAEHAVLMYEPAAPGAPTDKGKAAGETETPAAQGATRAEGS